MPSQADSSGGVPLAALTTKQVRSDMAGALQSSDVCGTSANVCACHRIQAH